MVARNIQWTGNGGDTLFQNANNWQDFTNNLNPAATPPGVGENPSLTQTVGGTITGTGTVASITLGSFQSGSWVLSGATLVAQGFAANPTFLPTAVFDGAPSLTINGGTLDGSGGLFNISPTTNGTMTAQGGAKVSVAATYVSSNGTLVVTGPGTTWHDIYNPAITGQGGNGFLAFTGPAQAVISNQAVLTDDLNAQIGTNQNSSGTISITTGAIWNVGTGGIAAGNQGSSGLISVTSGTVTTTGAIGLGNGTASLGRIALNSGVITAAGNTNIGNSGDGTVTIGNGGTFLANGTFGSVGNNNGSNGALIINSGGTFQNAGTGFNVGNNAGSSGLLIVNAGGTYKSTVPSQGANFVLSIGVNSGTTLLPGGVGTALVTGAGALIDTNGNPMQIGRFAGASGSLTIAQGGSVVAGSPDTNVNGAFYVAQRGGTGNVTITDAGSALTVNGFALIGRGGDGSLLLQNSGAMTVNDDPLANGGGMHIGKGRNAGPTGTNDLGGNGVANVISGGLLTINSTLFGLGVGGNGASGILNVNTGGTVLAGSSLAVGEATTAGGVLYGGSGAINIGPGGLVKIGIAAQTSNYSIIIGNANSTLGNIPTNVANGEVLVSGAGAMLNSNGNAVAVGLLSDGMLTVSKGGTVVAGSLDGSVITGFQVGRLGNGSVNLSDLGSALLVSGGMNVGRGGSGALVVENAASLTVTTDSNSANAYLTIGNTGLANATTLLTGGAGSALFTKGGSGTADTISVGNNGDSGVVTVNNGGVVTANQRLTIGNSILVPVGDIITTITGNTTLTADTRYAGDGTVNIGAGGTLIASGTGISNTSTASVVIGNGIASTGALNVNGAGAMVTETGRFVVGEAAIGQLTIAGGGTVVANAGTGAANGVVIGSQSGSNGSSVLVSGTTSTWQIASGLMIGDAGDGFLTVTNGAAVTAETLQEGNAASGAGHTALSGAGSSLTLSGGLIVGAAGAASLTIYDGAIFNATSATVGGTAGGSGNIDVEKAGSYLHLTGSLDVGLVGSGVVTVGNGATLTVAGTVHVGANGVLLNQGGTIDPPALVIDSGGSSGGFGTFEYGTVTNQGTFFVTAGKAAVLSVDAIVSDPGNPGVIVINTGSDLTLNAGTVDANQTIQFVGTAGGTLEIANIAGFQPAAVNNFRAADHIVIQNQTSVSVGFDVTTQALTIINSTGTTLSSFVVAGTHTAADFATAVTVVPTCFVTGTRITTDRGEIAVEDLREGDKVWTVLGKSWAPIVWLGRRSVDCARHPRPEQAWPVRVSANAFGPGLPRRDLYLSPDHAVYIDGVLIPVKHLIDGRTIAQVRRAAVTYHHVELAEHDVILSEGLPSESYLETGARAKFPGYRVTALHPDFSPPVNAHAWEVSGCAPLVLTGVFVEAARAKLQRGNRIDLVQRDNRTLKQRART